MKYFRLSVRNLSFPFHLHTRLHSNGPTDRDRFAAYEHLTREEPYVMEIAIIWGRYFMVR